MLKNPAISDERAPAISDPRWAEWASPLLEFLQEPREWPAIHDWCKRTKFETGKLRNCIAWLEENGRIRTVYRKGQHTWVRMRPSVQQPSPERPFIDRLEVG